ncbi:MAG: hypothetical protein HY289_09520, partial [Planctomycetes bacterium]|nr:hypothetical protein [Planctomycetota bacterium]
VLMYFLLTGHVPYETLKDPDEILLSNVRTPTPRFSHWHVNDVPAAIERLVLSCLSKSPAERPESARALIETFQLSLGHRFLDETAFAASQESAVSSLRDVQAYDPRNVIDQFEACMLEQMAAMKLRGFVDGVGGQVAESDAGVIKVRLPRALENAPPKKGLWSWLTAQPEPSIDWIALEIHMAKKQVGPRSLVDITVVRPNAQSESIEQARGNKQFCEQICRELRAYLMVGR